MSTKFEKGEVVWGKIKGYPWWPAIIIDNNNLIYTIKFYNDNSLANLSSKFLLKYEENKQKISESNKKNKKLMEAIKFADSELNNNNTNETLLNSNYNISDTNYSEKSKMSIDNEKIKTPKINNSSHNINFKKLEKNNNIINNNLINKTETMSNQNNRVNIFSIIKNSKNNNALNKMNSRKPVAPPAPITPTIVEKNEDLPPAQKQNIDKTKTESANNNKIIIKKSLLRFDSDDEKKIFLTNINNEINDIKNENIFKKEEKESDEKNINIEEEDNNKEKQENYFIKIEIESLEMKSSKKKEGKVKSGNDEKIKEEKKREEEDYLIYQIDEYLCKIVDYFNNRQIEKLINEKPILKKMLSFLSKYKRSNFIEFLKRININKYIQFFINYFKPYDPEIYNLAKKVHRNFHIQFNKEYFSNQATNI